MNTSDVREMHGTQNFFWAIAGPPSFSIVALAMIFAFRAELRRIFWGPRSDSKASVRITKDPEHAPEVFKGE